MTAEAAISTTVKLLSDLLIQKANFLGGIEGEVESLKDELNRMQSFLRDANRKQSQDDRVRDWISSIRELALDAEDAIEVFNLNVENPRESRGFVKRSIPFPTEGAHLVKFRNRISSFHSRLEAIRITCEMYGIRDVGKPRESPGRSEIEASHQFALRNKDELLVGVEDDVKKLLEHIMDEDNKGLSVAAVVGMEGIGKSALAREVYNHPDVICRFECRAWVVVQMDFAPQETLKQLILQTTKSEQEKQELRQEIKQLKRSTRGRFYRQLFELKLKELLRIQLEGKTYFIVLDDVWKREDWVSLMTAFPNEQDETSRLLLTTRHNAIVEQCQSLHKMKVLDPEKSWELFLKKGHADNSNEEFPRALEQIGRHIVEKCEGLPLSIILMRGLLVDKRSSREWKEALDELYSQLGKAKSSISAILELCYQNLPPELKSCFLCLAFFKENVAIPVKRLVNIMVGQGLNQQMGRTSWEKIARGYLDELINRNMVKVKDLTLDQRVKSFLLRGSLHIICLEKAKKEIDIEFLKRGIRIHERKPRHRMTYCDGLTSIPSSQNKQVRSLFLFNVEEDFRENMPYWSRFELLKILDLDCDFPLGILPHSFSLLLGLKQLTIRRQTNKISFSDLSNPSSRPLKLPTWLYTLKKLELLDLGIELVEFPNVAMEMDSMRRIHAYCVHGPMITDSWKNVETLKYIRQNDWMRSHTRLKGDCHIRELGIVLHKASGKVSESFDKLENLVKLYLIWNYRLPVEATIIIPHLGNLTKLKLNGMMRKCPSASMIPPNLTHLTLENSFLDEDPMQELGKLPKLLYLKLKDHSYMGERMQVLHGDFPCLIGLHLREMCELREVVIKEGGMPQLKLLQVRDCHALDTKNLSNNSYQLQILDTA